MGNKGYTIKSDDRIRKLSPQSGAIAPYKEAKLNGILERTSISEDALKLSVVRMVISCLNSSKERKLAPLTIERLLEWFKCTLMPYVNQIPDVNVAEDDLEVFNSDFLSWLKKNKSTDKQAARDWNELQRFSKKFCQDRKNSQNLTNQILDLKERKPLKVEYDSLKTMSLLYPDLGLDNDLEILVGCQEFLIWYLNEMNSARQFIKDNLTIRLEGYYQELKNQKKAYEDRYENFSIGLTSLKIHYRDNVVKPESEKKFTPDFTELTDLIKLVHTYKNPVIQEMMFVELLGVETFLRFYIDQKRVFNLDEINEFVSNFWTGNDRYAPANIKGEREQLKLQYSGSIKELHKKGLAQITFPTLSFSVIPSKQEKIAMSWLCAAARSQSGGLETLTYKDNILHDPIKRTIQIVQEKKNRQRGAMKSDFKQGHDSPIYHNDNHYQVLRDWSELVNNSYKYVADYDGKFLPNFTKHERSSTYRNSNYFLWLAATEGTYTNNAIKAHIAGNQNEKSVLDFLSLVERNQHEIKKTVERNKKNKRKAAKLRQKGVRAPKKKSRVKQDRISIQTIAQTRAIVDTKPTQNLSLLGHTDSTHYNTYINRTKSKYVNSEAAAWAADIGNAFISEAIGLYGERAYQESSAKLEDTTFLSISAAKKILDIVDITGEDDPDFIQSIINQSESEGFTVDLSGILESKDKTIVLITPWTCALIISNINYIKTQLQHVEITTSQKTFKELSQVIYLKLLLERFPKNMQSKAKKLLDDYNVPFVEGLKC